MLKVSHPVQQFIVTIGQVEGYLVLKVVTEGAAAPSVGGDVTNFI